MLLAFGNVTFLWLGKPLDIWRPEPNFSGYSNAVNGHEYRLLTTNITTISVIRTTPISINVGLWNFVWLQIFEMLGYANFVCVCVCCVQIATGSSLIHAYHFTVLIASVSVRERGKERQWNVSELLQKTTTNVGQNSDRQGLEMKSSPLKTCFILFYLWFVYKRHQ